MTSHLKKIIVSWAVYFVEHTFPFSSFAKEVNNIPYTDDYFADCNSDRFKFKFTTSADDGVYDNFFPPITSGNVSTSSSASFIDPMLETDSPASHTELIVETELHAPHTDSQNHYIN